MPVETQPTGRKKRGGISAEGQPPSCDDLGGCTNYLFPFYYQFKFPVSPLDFDKPCFCMQAKTWFVKIKWRHRELELIVKREQRICTSPQNIKKRWLQEKKTLKSTQRGTVSCISCVFTHILFSFFFLLFLLVCAKTQTSKRMTEEMNYRNKNVNGIKKNEHRLQLKKQLLQETGVRPCLFVNLFSVLKRVWTRSGLVVLFHFKCSASPVDFNRTCFASRQNTVCYNKREIQRT